MARPRKEIADRRIAQVLVKLTTAEREYLAGEAKRVRMPLAVLVRDRALRGTVTIQQGRELEGVDRVALNRVGVNLNQIARHLNEQGAPAIVAIADELHGSLARLNALLVQGADDGSEPL